MKMEHLVMPSTLDEALGLLQADKRNRLIGGGAWMRLGTQSYDTVIGLDRLGLNTITEHQNYIDVGAMVPLRDVETHSGLQAICCGILPQAVSVIMGLQVRNIATIGGSIAGKYSFSDILPVLIALDAAVLLYPMESMKVTEYLSTKHLDTHIVIGVRIPKQSGTGYFKKVSKTLLDFSILNLAIVKTDRTTIVVGARPGVAMEASKANEYLSSQDEWNEDVMETAIQLAVHEIPVSSNNRAEAMYRKELLEIYLKRGLQEVM
jgi:CO/xanthine dehydrogenase FAD-binding subunit